MTTGSDDDDPNITVETTTLQFTISTGTLTSPSLPTLPFELILEEILCRLPVKFLLQLRCICKSWNSLISDSKFAKKHLRLSKKRHHLICSQANTYSCPTYLSSCDGILCFAISDNSAALWNPSIRKFKMLTHFENPRKKVSHSFGYDHFIDNYKIIAISLCTKPPEVSVLTLGDDYWRRIPDFPYSDDIFSPGIFVSGTVNWLVYDILRPGIFASDTPTLVSLNLEKESYQKLPQPDLVNGFKFLGMLRDCLCIFANREKFLDVWIMKEYGNKESWTKLYTIHYPIDLGLCFYTNTLYDSGDDQMMMVLFEFRSSEFKLVVYNSKNDTLNISDIQNINRWWNSGVYIESLISPCS